MFGNGIPDTLPAGYGDDVQVESFTQTPGEIKALEKFVKSADGVIIKDAPKGPNPELKRIPKSEDFISYPKRLRSTPWAPLPPYVGKEMGEMAGYTPYNRGEGVPLHMVAPKNKVQQEWKPMYSGAARNYGAPHSYGKVPDSPLTVGAEDGWMDKSVTHLETSLLATGVQPGATHVPGTFDSAMTEAVKAFQQKWNVTFKDEPQLQLQVTGIYDRATELALRRSLGEDVTAAAGGMTGQDYIMAGTIGTELIKLFKGSDEPLADTPIVDVTQPSGPSLWPIVAGVIIMGFVITGVIWVRGKPKEGAQ